MGISDYLNGPKLKVEVEQMSKLNQDLNSEINKLKESLQSLGGLELVDVEKRIFEEKANLEALNDAEKKKEDDIKSLEQKIAELQQQVLVVDEVLLLESFAIYTPKFSLTSSDEYKERLDKVRATEKDMIKKKTATKTGQAWTVNNSATEGQRLVNDMIKLLIRSFNNESDYCVDNVKFNNIEQSTKKIQTAFETLNKLGKVMNVSIASGYYDLKIEELRLAHEYQIKKQEEKEEAKRIREELREQQKLEQEIRAAREKIAKERKHFAAALKDLEDRLAKASDEAERLNIENRLAEIRLSCSALDSEESEIDYREKNAKAGYIYVISNIGAFGEGVYKVGMTRRLEPLDRIDELSDASVPFRFDLHAMIFSDNAPALEGKIHQAFEKNRINKINSRKEFFRVELKAIEDVIRSNYDAAVEFTEEAAAEDYRESLRLI